MCLNIGKNTVPKIAYRDIECYKFLDTVKPGTSIFHILYRKLFNQSRLFLTPYMYTKVRIGATYRSGLEVNSQGDLVSVGLHSYADIASVRETVLTLGYKYSYYVIVKCVIPKGSVYYEGVTGLGNLTSFASDRLTYVEILEEYEKEELCV